MAGTLIQPLKINRPNGKAVPQLNIAGDFGAERNLATQMIEIGKKAETLQVFQQDNFFKNSTSGIESVLIDFEQKMKYDKAYYQSSEKYEETMNFIKEKLRILEKDSDELGYRPEIRDKYISSINSKIKETETKFLEKYFKYSEDKVKEDYKFGQLTNSNNITGYMANGDYNRAFKGFADYISDGIYAIENGIVNSDDFIKDGFKLRNEMIKAYPLSLMNETGGEQELIRLGQLTKEQFNTLFSDLEINIGENKIGLSANDYESFMKGVKQAYKTLKINTETEKAENTRKIEDSIYKNDAHSYIYYSSDKKINPTTQDLINNTGDVMSTVTNLDVTTFGNPNSTLVFPYITPAINSGVNQKIETLKKNPNATYRDIYQPVYDMANELSGGNLTKKNAILKNWALENKIHPTVILQGEQDPNMFRVASLMTKGNMAMNESGLDISKIELSGKYKKAFNLISTQFSEDKILGDRLATQFLLGYADSNKQLELILENPSIGIRRILNDKQIPLFINDIKTATKFTTNAVDYHYIKLGSSYQPQHQVQQNTQNQKQSILFIED